jgi:methyltransferase family protein
VTIAGLDLDPYLHDPEHRGASMAQLSDVILPCLDAAGARSVVEVGALAGDLTRVLVDWAQPTGARVCAVDPSPRESLLALARDHAEVELVRETSVTALGRLELPDAVIIDGDHNYFTVSEELRLVEERSDGGPLPLLMLHDVCWPHGRRDDYFAAERIPQEYRRPVAGATGGLFPGEPGLRPDGLAYPGSAVQEGGPRNGVLTAVEDFLAGRAGLRLSVVPAFFGLGVIWRVDAAYADDLERIVGPLDRSALLERLERNRVEQLAHAHAVTLELQAEAARRARLEAVLRRLLESSAFAVAERLSRLRRRAGVAPGQSVVSKDEIRGALKP